jgi:hypothetical protein
MTPLAALLWLLTLAAGAVVAGLVRVPLRVEERAALAVVAGVELGALLALPVTVVAGMSAATVLAGPLLLALCALAVAWRAGDPRGPWRQSLGEVPERWRSRDLWAPLALLVAATVGFSVVFAHTLFVSGQDIVAGFPTVWADWSLHATSASSFAVGHNLPPHDPIFSGTPYRYPFLPDFHSGMLLALGVSPAAALAIPDAVLCVAVTLLVVALARRLTGSVTAGVVAMAICLLGGGLGAGGLWWDACSRASASPAQCAPQHAALHPADALRVLHAVPATVADQPRAYDGLLTDPSSQPAGNLQWYTPLLAWWLPQRTFVHGFAIGVAVLLLVTVGLRRPPPAWSPFLLAGVLAGTLPLVHVHSLVALGVALPLVALARWRREWLGLAGVTAVIAVPRLAQIAAGGHGVDHGPYGSNVFPYLEPGWKWNPDSDPARIVSLAQNGLLGVVGRILRVLLDPGFWGFWLLNTGILVPACAVLLGAVVLGRRRSETPIDGAPVRRLGAAVSDDLALVCAPFMLLFLIANVVVFQSWDWDNTKLFAYWQLAAALLVGAWVARWWRGGPGRAAAATLALASLLLTGGLVMLRSLPWTPSQTNPGSYVWASRDDRDLAAAVAARTPRDAIILTGGRPNDPLLTLAGRTAVMGYAGWLNSYGTDFGSRPGDVHTMYAGCPGVDQGCPVAALLHRYGVSFVELGSWEREQEAANDGWWAAHYPVLARAGGTTVYDVRHS